MASHAASMAIDLFGRVIPSRSGRRTGMIVVCTIVANVAGPAAATEASNGAGDRTVVVIAGVYRERLGVVEVGDRYVSESVMEIVPFGHGDAYVRLRTMWANYHQYSMYGIFHAEGNSLVHRSRTRVDEACSFTVERRADRFVIRDPSGGCDSSCGARGSFDGDDRFRPLQKRRIRYLSKILTSDEYRAAVAAHLGRIPRSDTMLLPDMEKQVTAPVPVVRLPYWASRLYSRFADVLRVKIRSV